MQIKGYTKLNSSGACGVHFWCKVSSEPV